MIHINRWLYGKPEWDMNLEDEGNEGEIKTEIIKEQGDYLKEHLHKVADVAEKLQKKGWLGCSTLYTLEFYKEKITKKQAEQELKQLKVDKNVISLDEFESEEEYDEEE